MTPDKRTGINDLEIDFVRAPFRDVVATKILREQPENRGALLLAGSADIKAEFPRMRAEMLRGVFEIFATRESEIEPRVSQLMRGGFDGAEASYAAVMSVVEDSLTHAITDVPEFNRLRQLYDISHNGRGFALGEHSARGELLRFTGHGIGVMMGFFEVVPAVFESTYGRSPTQAELAALIPACTDRILSAMSRVTGAFAIEVESEMGMESRHLGYGDSTYTFPQFDSDRFAFRSVEGKDVLDVTREVTRDVRRNVEVGRTQYHGCLAGLVKMPTSDQHSPAQTVFARMKELTSKLMLEHAFPDIRG